MKTKRQMMKLGTGFGVASLSAFLLASLLAPSAKAANLWDGGGANDNWDTPLNWDDDNVPGFPAALTFGGATRLTPSNDLTDVTVNGITFAAGAGAFTLGGNPLTLSGDVAIELGGGVTNNQVIDFPITLGTSPVLSAAPVPGHFTGNKGVLVLNGVISGPFGLTSGVTGSTKNYVQLNGANTYTGNTLITGGDASFSIGNANAFGSGKVIFGAYPGDSQEWIQSVGNLTVTNDVEIRTGRFITASYTIAGKVAGNLTLGGNVLLNQNSGGNFYCQKDLTLSGTVSGGNLNGLKLAVGKIILQGNNTFTNNLYTSSTGTPPTLNINSDAALGHTNNGVYAAVNNLNFQTASGTSISLAPSRRFDSSSGKTITFDIPSTSTLAVPGPITGNAIAKASSSGTLALTGANTYSGGTILGGGTLSINADTALGASSGALSITAAATLQATTNLSLSADRTLNLTNASAYTVTFAVPTNTAMAVAGVIKGNAATNSALSKTGPGTLILAGGAGGTQLNALSTLEGKVSVTNGAWAINTASTDGENSPFWVAGGTTFEQTGGTLNLSRYPYIGVRYGGDPTTNQVSNAIFSGGTLTQEDPSSQLLVGRKNSAVLTVSGDAALNLVGLTLGEYPGFTTVCNIDGGTVAARYIYSRATTGLGSLTAILNLNGGTLRATANGLFIGATGGFLHEYLTAVTVKSGGAVIDSQAYSISINQVLNHDPDLGAIPDGGLIKRGTGSLTLSTNTTYTGVTLVEAGTLKLAVADTLMASNCVSVSSNATFDVNGKSQTLAGLGGSGTVSNNSLLTVTQAIAPGGTNVIGTLTLAAAPASMSGVFLADVAADGSCDRLHVQGDLDLSGLALAVADTSAWNKDQQYVIASYTGALTGPFASAALPDRWNVRYDRSSRQVFLSYDFGLVIMIR